MTDQLIRTLLSQGILGIISALFIGLYLRELSEHKAAKTAAAADTKALLEQASKDQQTAADRHAYDLKQLYVQMDALRGEHAQEIQDLLQQINDLREAHAQRERACLSTVEFFAKQEVEAVEELARIAEMLRRSYEARTRR